MEREQLTATVRAAQQGDEKALSLLFNTYYNDVYYFALKTLKDEDLACDITQETFVEIINTLGELKVPEAFVTWMRQVTYHQCTRYFKKKKEVLVEEDEDGNTLFDTLEEERQEFIPGEGVDQEDFRATILALLDTLSEEQRAAVLMHYYHEMSVKEIAEAQKVSEGTVKSRLNYARKSLKKSVEDYEKKHDVKLHCAGVLPLLLWLFASAGEEVMPVAAAKTVAGGVASATGTAIGLSAGGGVATATATAGTGLMAKIAAVPVAVKIISGITAGALLIGSVAVVSDKLGKSPEPTNPAVMQTEPSGSEHQGENNETTVPSSPIETEPDPIVPMAYIVPEGCTYYCADGTVIDAGSEVWVQVSEGDRLVTQMFEYTYSMDLDGWKAARHVNNTTYEPFLAEINGEPLTSLAGVFYNHTGLGISPEIPAGVKYIQYAFAGCNYLQAAPAIPDGVVNMEAAFSECWCIQEVAEIPASVMNMTRTFADCYLLTGEIVINATPTAFEGCFAPYMGWFGKPIILTGTGGNLEEIAATSSLGNVTVDLERLNNPQTPDLPEGSETPAEQPSEQDPPEPDKPAEPPKPVEYIQGNGYKRVKDFDPATNTGEKGFYFNGDGFFRIYEDEYIFEVTAGTLTYEMWCSWDTFTQHNFTRFCYFSSDDNIDDKYNFRRITECDNYTCGWEDHFCYSEQGHQSLLEEMARGCHYCGKTDCISFLAREKTGFTTTDTHSCPEYDVRKDPTEYCQNCGYPEWGQAKAGEIYCSKVLNHDLACHRCGEMRYVGQCHHCVVPADYAPPDAHFHVYNKQITAPTCTQPGVARYVCSCGDSSKGEEIPAPGHTYGEWVVVKEATSDEQGVEETTCATCGEVLSRTFAFCADNDDTEAIAYLLAASQSTH